MYKTDSDKLRYKISEKGLSLEDVAMFLGIDRATLYRRIKNNSLRISDMQKITEILCLSGEEAKNIFLAS